MQEDSYNWLGNLYHIARQKYILAPLADIKNSFQLQLAENCTAINLEKEPAILWWVYHASKKKKQVIKSIKMKC